MSERNITVEDSLGDYVSDAIESVEEAFLEYLNDNKPDRCPNRNKLDYNGAINEIVDSSVPIYTKEIKDTWHLYACELEEAYENAGVGSNPRENDGMTAIYFYIDEKVNEWFHTESEEIFDEWKKKQKPSRICEKCDGFGDVQYSLGNDGSASTGFRECDVCEGKGSVRD